MIGRHAPIPVVARAGRARLALLPLLVAAPLVVCALILSESLARADWRGGLLALVILAGTAPFNWLALTRR